MTKRSQNALQREEMTPFEGRATVTIFFSLEDIEKRREIFFLLKKEGSTIYAFGISEDSCELYFVDGTTNKIPTPKGYFRLMINNIISDLRSGKIKSKTEYDFRKFDERYLKDLKELLSQKTTTTGLQEKSTTRGVEHETQATGVTDSTTTELFDSSQSEKPTTERVEHETQATGVTDSTTTELFNSSQLEESTTEEIKHVMEEIKRLNASHGITTENIEYVQDMTRKDVTFSFSKVTSRNVPAFSKNLFIIFSVVKQQRQEQPFVSWC